MIKSIVYPFSRWMRSLLKQSLILLCACIVTSSGPYSVSAEETGARKSAQAGDTTEMHLPTNQPLTPWVLDPEIFKTGEEGKTELRKITEQEVETIKLSNLVPPIYFGRGEIEISGDYLQKLRKVLDSVSHQANVRLHFIGHADNLPLRGELAELYGNNTGLSRERAGTIAVNCQKALDLPTGAVSYEGLGNSQPVANNATRKGRRKNRRVEVQVWYDKVHKKTVEKKVAVQRNVNRVKVCRTETVCKLRYKDGFANRARIKNLISPLHYDKGVLSVTDEFLRQVRQSMKDLSNKENLVIKFIGYTDDLPLKGRDKRIYGNAAGFTRAVARRIARAVRKDLGLPDSAIETEGQGSSQPVTVSNTEKGRALNRRVEVEFWYDDPLNDLDDELQLCPGDGDSEAVTVTRVYDSPLGAVDPIQFKNGSPVIPKGYTAKLQRIMDEIKDKTHVRLRFTGYTGNERLDRRTAMVYGDDVGLSMDRARRTLTAVNEKMALTEDQVEFDGSGYVQSGDVVNSGFIKRPTSQVKVQVVYDELILSDEYEGVEANPVSRKVVTANPFALNYMRITVDGKPIDDPEKACSDVQRCIDVALENAQIQFNHDSLKLEPRLNVTAWPRTIRYQDLPDTEFVESMVHFRLYTNYRSFIERAEVRVFDEAQSVNDTPIDITELDIDGMGSWQADFESFTAPLRKLKYLVRVYGKDGLFDETAPQPMWIADKTDMTVTGADTYEELLAGYGESRIARRNIPLHGGTVKVYGTAIPEGNNVWMAGYKVPVDEKGCFVSEQILPEGLHTVEVAVLDGYGNGELFLRDLALKKSDWFTVGIADLTVSANKTNGPADLLAEEQKQYSEDMSIDGRLAFYTNGKFGNGWSLTASADTEEGPLDEIFSNFMDKEPESLFRRMDPDYHYPTFGDDSTVTDDAPTSGKFYVKMKKNKTYGLWGNFKIGYTDNDLAHVDRGLYGSNLHFQPSFTTTFGEPRLMLDVFGADPGTISGRDEFRGTGGSLYFLKQQDILEGSESVRIEVRDKDSGIVLGVKNLTSVLDYDIDYFQGRILLSEPLSPTADDGLLVSSGSLSGHKAYLVMNYEYTPGFEDPDNLVFGGRAQWWLNDYIKVGVTASREEEVDFENSLEAADITLRASTQSWIKVEAAQTSGKGTTETTSIDGGYNFDTSDDVDSETEASAYRVEASLGFNDILKSWQGRAGFYLQDVEGGYSAPGQITTSDVIQYGGLIDLPVTGRINTQLKVDKKEIDEGLVTESGELDLNYLMGNHWTLGSGVRFDNREDNSILVPLTQEEGELTVGVLRLNYDSLSRFTTYGYVQDTINSTGNREENDRIGIGGSFRVTDRFNLTGEVSGGDLGPGGKLGTEFLYSDRTTLYSNYCLENERSDNGIRASKGNMTSGFRTRYSDSVSIYLEEQYNHGDIPTGLTHSTGVELAPTDSLNFGANLDFGTLKNNDTGAELERMAAGLSAGYGFNTVKIRSGLEYRVDDSEQDDTTTIRQTTWLLKNSLKYQMNPDWRLICKFNYATSESSEGDYYDGDYTEGVLGGAYRPIENDRLNALFKYTYFYNVPALDLDTDTSSGAGVIQRSHIGAMDFMYDLTERWTVGGKYAYRYGQLSTDRVDPDFYISRAHLSVLRAEWHSLYAWDALLEGRMLDLPDANDRLDGVLAGIYRHIGNHIKIGVGYNFSKFSDDLTDLDYDHQGFFINIIGKL